MAPHGGNGAFVGSNNFRQIILELYFSAASFLFFGMAHAPVPIAALFERNRLPAWNNLRGNMDTAVGHFTGFRLPTRGAPAIKWTPVWAQVALSRAIWDNSLSERLLFFLSTSNSCRPPAVVQTLDHGLGTLSDYPFRAPAVMQGCDTDILGEQRVNLNGISHVTTILITCERKAILKATRESGPLRPRTVPYQIFSARFLTRSICGTTAGRSF